ncbi:hypothetical protein BAE44_0017230 [Dichanthelium oligosanthes]|uniref:PAP/OAS1 substrate-binding-related domain-containing protein n=1 Tax=Dichanthelium oligosanthes TaxID=888268 RepID=A0A1E5V9F5_9POAL|nr:hypothetical protein BAE44_0017230 [Dichanthelium oligosanthes]
MCAAEAAAGEVVLRVHPTEEAERRRQDVIDYLKRLIGSSVGCEVFAFGSVPLRTYLPNGDVDITVLGNTWLNSTFIDDVRSVLESEQENCDAEFKVTGLHFINAEVKLMKCVIENIVVDVSFNQIGGVSTFCFLELVDRQVGKNHLFKRTIMLIKAWCYHESRILGAHHGLISTYALETLVLYIFNMFHKSLHGPLEAFYRFLEYFSKFDWDKYGISLNGPVDLSLLPNLTVDPTALQEDLLLEKEFLQGFLDRLIVIPNESDGCDTQFRQKFLNIIDPLKVNNNLGRSVSKANFYRIRSAFSFGAQKLGQILMLSSESIGDEIYGFFTNTLKRHGKGERPDIGSYSSFQSLLGPENALSEDGSRLKISCMNEGENRSAMLNKELSVTDGHKNSSRCWACLVQDRPWNKIWFMEHASDFSANSSYVASLRSHSSFSCENGNGNSKVCVENYAAEADISRLHMPQQIYVNHPLHILGNSTRTNILDFSSSCPANESDWTALHADERPLPPFLLSNMLNLSGDLDLHLGCLCKVQYHLESLFDELLQAVKEVCLAGVLDEDSFKIPTMTFKSKLNTGSGLSLASSIDSERRKLSPVYCSHSTGDDSQQPHAEAQVDVVWQQNLQLSYNGSALSLSPSTNSDNYAIPWFCISPKSQGTGTYIPQMVKTLNAQSYYLYSMDKWILVTSGSGRKLQILEGLGSVFISFITKILIKILVGYRHSTFFINQEACFYSFNLLSCFHFQSYYTYQERMTLERQIMRERRLRQRVGRQYYSAEQGNSSPQTELTTAQSTTNQSPKKQTSLQQNCCSSKSSVPSGDFVDFKEHVATDGGTKQALGRDFVEKGTETRPPSSSGIVLPHNGQGNPQVSNTCHPSSPTTAEENIEFGSFGPFSLGLLSPQFEEAFPSLPTRKRAEEVPVPASKGPAEEPASILEQFEEAFPALSTRKRAEEVPVPASKRPAEAPGASTAPITNPVETESRSQEVYQLRDEADFPPLQAGCR